MNYRRKFSATMDIHRRFIRHMSLLRVHILGLANSPVRIITSTNDEVLTAMIWCCFIFLAGAQDTTSHLHRL